MPDIKSKNQVGKNLLGNLASEELQIDSSNIRWYGQLNKNPRPEIQTNQKIVVWKQR